MTTYERYAILLSVALLLAGIKADTVFPAAHWFARSGAMVTVVALIFASLNIKARLAGANTYAEEHLDDNLVPILESAKSEGMDDAECDVLADRIISEVRRDIRCEVISATKRVLRVELILFIVGTVVWAFGDLASDWLFVY